MTNNQDKARDLLFENIEAIEAIELSWEETDDLMEELTERLLKKFRR